MQDADPGRIRLKQAVRTTLSAIVTTCVLVLLGKAWSPLSGMAPILMGAMSATLTVLRISGETRREQQATTIVAGFSGIALILIAYAVYDDPLHAGLVISLLAFTVFYTRRFGLPYVGLGMYALFIYLFATVMAKTEPSPVPLAGAVALSIPVAYIINFYFLPENRRLFFRDTVFLFIGQAGRIGTLLSSAFCGRITTEAAGEQMHEALQELQTLLASSETTLNAVVTDNSDERTFLETIYMNEYRIYGALSLAIDGVLEAIQVEGPVARSLQEEMESAVRLLETLLQDTKRQTLRAPVWRDRLDQYQGLVDEFYNELLVGEGIKQKRVFFHIRILLAMRRIGRFLGPLCEDLMRFEEQIQT